jgi:chitin deacetylase
MPNVSVSLPNNGYPTYPNGESGADSVICSFTYQCTTADDLFNAPDGIIAVCTIQFCRDKWLMITQLSFDDGPTPNSPDLYTFLAQNNVSDKATHFMIGSNVMYK